MKASFFLGKFLFLLKMGRFEKYLVMASPILPVVILAVYTSINDLRLLPNDFMGYVWMAIEEDKYGMGMSTNMVTSSLYPLILNIFHQTGMSYQQSGAVLNFSVSIFILFFLSRILLYSGLSPMAVFGSCVFFGFSYYSIISIVAPLPDLLAFSLILPLFFLGFRTNINMLHYLGAGVLAGLACSVRYNFRISFVPLLIIFAVFSEKEDLKIVLRNIGIILLGILIGNIPYFSFSFISGHAIFKSNAPHFLLELLGKADFTMMASQTKNMGGPFDIIREHNAAGFIMRQWLQSFVFNIFVFVVPPMALFIFIAASSLKKSLYWGGIQRKVLALLFLIVILLLPLSIRPHIFLSFPYIMMISFFTFVAMCLLIWIIIQKYRWAKMVILVLCVFVTMGQIIMAHRVLDGNDRRFPQMIYGREEVLQIADVLVESGITDPTEVLNLAGPFTIYWPYGKMAPVWYYRLKEMGWVSTCNFFPKERPFLYDLTEKNINKFSAILIPSFMYKGQQMWSEFIVKGQIGAVVILSR